MNATIHHIPGRLRLKLAQIRKNPGRTHEAQAAVCRIAGVSSVKANSRTGSLLIHYDMKLADARTILRALAASGLLPAVIDGGKTSVQPTLAPTFSPLSTRLLDIAVGKLLERSAMALFGTLL